MHTTCTDDCLGITKRICGWYPALDFWFFPLLQKGTVDVAVPSRICSYGNLETVQLITVQADHCGCIWTRIFLLLTVDTITGEDFLQWRLFFASELLKLKKISSTLNVGGLLFVDKTMTGETMEWNKRITSDVLFVRSSARSSHVVSWRYVYKEMLIHLLEWYPNVLRTTFLRTTFLRTHCEAQKRKRLAPQ